MAPTERVSSLIAFTLPKMIKVGASYNFFGLGEKYHSNAISQFLPSPVDVNS